MSIYSEDLVSITAEVVVNTVQSIIPESRRVMIFAKLSATLKETTATNLGVTADDIFYVEITEENHFDMVNMFEEENVRLFITEWFKNGGILLTVCTSQAPAEVPLGYSAWVANGKPTAAVGDPNFESVVEYKHYEAWVDLNKPSPDDNGFLPIFAEHYDSWFKYDKWLTFLRSEFSVLLNLPYNLVFGLNNMFQAEQIAIFNIYKDHMKKDLHLCHFIKIDPQNETFRPEYSTDLSIFIAYDNINVNFWCLYLVNYQKYIDLESPSAYISSKMYRHSGQYKGELVLPRKNLRALCNKYNVGCLTNIIGTSVPTDRQFFDNIVEYNSGADHTAYLITGDIKFLSRNRIVNILPDKENYNLRKNDVSIEIIKLQLLDVIKKSYILNRQNKGIEYISNLVISNDKDISQQLSKGTLEGFGIEFTYLNEVNGITIKIKVNVVA